MAFWKSSNTFGIDYHIMRTPESHNYFPGDPVSSGVAAKAEVALMASVAANHQAVLYGMWQRGIVPIETNIVRAFSKYRYVQSAGARYGVLLVANCFESIGTQPVQRGFEDLYIDDAYPNFEHGLSAWQRKNKLLPAKPNLKLTFYHIWAVRK